jgi:hypothetical protein
VARVLLFAILQQVPVVLLLVLIVKDEPDLEFQIKLWWFLLVLLLHVPGYLIFRLWIAVRRRGRRADGPA